MEGPCARGVLGYGGGGGGRSGSAKVYCERCDAVFPSRAEYERHLDRHSGGAAAGCEECPLDTAVSRFLGLFRGRGGR